MGTLPVTGLDMGLLVGATTILSVGPNNLMMLRAGLADRGNVSVAGCVWVSYVSLLACAYLAVGAPATDPWLQRALTWVGVAVLAVFAAQSFASAAAFLGPGGRGDGQVRLARALAVIWLNPLTYLEMFVMPVALGGSLDQATQRLPFIGGLVIMTTLCCLVYTGAGRFIAGFVTSARTVQVFDLASGLLLGGMAALLARSQLL